MKRKFVIIGSIVVFLALVGGGFYLYLKKSQVSADINTGGTLAPTERDVSISLPSDINIDSLRRLSRPSSEVGTRSADDEKTARALGNAINSYVESHSSAKKQPATPSPFQEKTETDFVLNFTVNGKPVVPPVGEVATREATPSLTINWDDQSFLDAGLTQDQLNQLKSFQLKVTQFLKEKLGVSPLYSDTIEITTKQENLLPSWVPSELKDAIAQLFEGLASEGGVSGNYIPLFNGVVVRPIPGADSPISADTFVHEFIHAYHGKAVLYMESTAVEGIAEGITQLVRQAVVENPGDFGLTRESFIYKDMEASLPSLPYDLWAGPAYQGPINQLAIFSSFSDNSERYELTAKTFNKIYYDLKNQGKNSFYSDLNALIKAEVDSPTGRLLNAANGNTKHQIIFGGGSIARKESLIYQAAVKGRNPAQTKIEGQNVDIWLSQQPSFSLYYRPGKYIIQTPKIGTSRTDTLVIFERTNSGEIQPLPRSTITFTPASSSANFGLSFCKSGWGNNTAKKIDSGGFLFGLADFSPPLSYSEYKNFPFVYGGIVTFTADQPGLENLVKVVEVRKDPSSSRCIFKWWFDQYPRPYQVLLYAPSSSYLPAYQRHGTATFVDNTGQRRDFMVANGAALVPKDFTFKTGQSYKVYFADRLSGWRPILRWQRTIPADTSFFRVSFPQPTGFRSGFPFRPR